MIDILQHVAGLLILSSMMLAVWTSSVMLGERKERYRAGTHDYYDNPINKKDITNKKRMIEE